MAARLRAVARAMRPFGTTVAMHDQTDRPFGRIESGYLNTILTLELNLIVVLVERLRSLRRMGVELVGKIDDDSWHSTFRLLALRSRLIVMDVSSIGSGLAYEADYLRDLGLAGRVILIHHRASAADAHVRQFQHGGLNPPVVSYRPLRLRRLTTDLRRTARLVLGATS